MISVPIEHGIRGFAKYCAKRFLYGYSVGELGLTESQYVRILLSTNRISIARPKAAGYGTHYGFDYRDVDDILRSIGVMFDSTISGMTRFYAIRN